MNPSSVPLVFIDTETTSLRRPWQSNPRQIWELAMIRREPDGSQVEFVNQLSEEHIDFEAADPFALQIGHYWDRRVPLSSGSTPGAIAKLAYDKTQGAHLVGAVPSFDEESLAYLIFKYNYLPRWHYHLVDVENLAAGALGLQPPYDSSKLFAEFGIETPEEERHTALGDARSAMRLYDAVMEMKS